jgi:DNA polymerase-3 subunit delta'
MSIATFAGQDAARARLTALLANDKLSHAYLFAGPEGSGKHELALAFAKAILCEVNATDACGECVSCRKIEHGTHDHVFEVAPDGLQIKIEQIRELQRQLANKLSDKPKIYIIQHAERMNVYAANSLLKFLEEPDTHVVAILLTNQESAMLPTILSRVQKIVFTPTDSHTMKAHLLQQVEGNAAFAEVRNLVIQLGKESLSKHHVPLVTIHRALPKQDVVAYSQIALDFMSHWYKDCIAVRHSQLEGLFFSEQVEWMKANVPLKSLTYWIDCFEHVLECKKKIRQNANPALAWDQLVIRNLG